MVYIDLWRSSKSYRNVLLCYPSSVCKLHGSRGRSSHISKELLISALSLGMRSPSLRSKPRLMILAWFRVRIRTVTQSHSFLAHLVGVNTVLLSSKHQLCGPKDCCLTACIRSSSLCLGSSMPIMSYDLPATSQEFYTRSILVLPVASLGTGFVSIAFATHSRVYKEQ